MQQIKRNLSKIEALLKEAQSCIHPLEIRSPYAEDWLALLSNTFEWIKPNRAHLELIKMITFYHQNNREFKICPQSNTPYIETTLEDIKVANELLNELLSSSLLPLATQSLSSGAESLSIGCRNFLVKLRDYLKSQGDNGFYKSDIQQAFELNRNTLKHYLRELVKVEVVKIVGGNRYENGYKYELQKADNHGVMSIKVTKSSG